MKDKSIFQNVKILDELKFKREGNFWLIYEYTDIWKHIATINYKKRESNIALYERAIIIIEEISK